MRHNTGIRKSFNSLLLAVGLIVVAGGFSGVSAQVNRDPFAIPEWARAKKPTPPGQPAGQPGTPGAPGKPAKPLPTAPQVVGAPTVQERIEYYKTLRAIAVERGLPIPKVTSVLTLDELSVTGIFKTPRGNAAMVQAVPIKLSYTVYPGEKFFDGQLVAVEENKLVFRKVSKMSNGKFVSSEENKILRQFTMQEEVQGTAPTETTAKSQPGVENQQPQPQQPPQIATSGEPKPVSSRPIVSPLDEMTNQPAEKEDPKKDKAGKKSKTAQKGKTAKVAKN